MDKSTNYKAVGRKILIVVIWFLCLAANIYATSAEPFRPADDAMVLARLPLSGDRSLRLLRARLKADPGNEELAVDLARRYLRRERAEGDPRYLGYAQAVLHPWWDDRKAAAPIALTRAQLLARRHAFDRALADLDGILSTSPHHPQALLSRAFILQSQGKISEAHTACRALRTRAHTLAAATCLARMESLGGKSRLADRRLTRALAHYAGENPRVRLWALTNLAKIAWRRGFPRRAEKLFRDALSLDRRDAYLRDAYADLLLELHRPSEVPALFGDDARSDGHLLRLALASRALDDSGAERYIADLASRFAESRRRGDALHLREEARFELRLRHNPSRALALALENWRTQREPADARLVLEAALAAGQPEKAGAVLDWMQRSGLEDRTLAVLAAKIEEAVG